MLCVSTVVRCPSVRLSRWIQMAEDIIELLSRPGSTIILVFLTPSADTQFQGELSQQERKIHWGGNFFCDFRLKSPFISETVRHRPIVAVKL